ncbi:hypothetical protein BC941DRAFT_472378 [Chlamydoabsidia padenii]|nr:hypothetical protein BC941DRAFT_472378 [Chlamydoabsidia padenii]
MSNQTPPLYGYMDPAYYQQQQQNFQVSPQQIQHLRHLQQQAAFHQVGYPQPPPPQQVMTLTQYQSQHAQPMANYDQATVESSEPSSSPEEKNQNKAARRREHNAIERARREHLNTKFQQLAHSLPNLQNDRRPSKGTIIERTLEFVKHTVQKEERYKNEIRELSRANRQLMRQVTSRSSLLAGGSIVGEDDDEENEEEDTTNNNDFDLLDYEIEDAITTTDDTLSRKSSCSSFAVNSLSSALTTLGSSTTTSPSLDYHSSTQWDPSTTQPYYHDQTDLYLQDHGYLLGTTTSSLDSTKQPMNNLHIKYESSFHC